VAEAAASAAKSGAGRQPGDDLGGGRAARRLEGEQLVAQPRQIRRHRPVAGHRRRRDLLLAQEDLDRAALERQPSGQGLEQHDADAVAVGRRHHRRGDRLFGRHVGRGADQGGVADLGDHGVAHQAEVEHHDPALARDQHVRGLEVAVDLAGAVQRLESERELAQAIAQALVVERAGQRRLGAGLGGDAEAHGQRIADVVEERDPVDQLHREEPVATSVVQLAQAHQVAVIEIGAGPKLGLQAVERVGLDRPQGLQRHDQIALAIVGLVHQAHATFADQAPQLEPLIALEPAAEFELGPGLGRVAGAVSTREARRRHQAIVEASRVRSA
jgi:hypothetical protein